MHVRLSLLLFFLSYVILTLLAKSSSVGIAEEPRQPGFHNGCEKGNNLIQEYGFYLNESEFGINIFF